MKGLCVAFLAAAHLLCMARKGADKTAGVTEAILILGHL